MKKIIFLILVLCGSFVFAVEFNIERSLSLSENEGETYLPTVYIDFGNDTVSKFELVIDDYDFFIFSNLTGDILVNSPNLFTLYKPSDNHKKVIISGIFSGKVELSGIKIRTYDQKISSATIGLNWTGDSSIDSYSTNVIELNQDGRYSDTMLPIPHSNGSYVITGNQVLLKWLKSPDLDLYTTRIRYVKNGNFYKDIYVGSNDSFYLTTELDTSLSRNFEIYARDIFYSSVPIILNVDFQNFSDQNDSDQDNQNQEMQDDDNDIETEKDTNQTQDDIIDNNELCKKGVYYMINYSNGECYIVDNYCKIKDPFNQIQYCDINNKYLTKSKIDFKNTYFSGFQKKFDKIIDSKLKNNTIIIGNKYISIRNDIMKLLKNYEDGIVNENIAIESLKALILIYHQIN